MADEVTLKVMVDKERNRVLYAEAGNDFVDALFSFLTLPLGTIARLVAAESNIEAMKFGSISSLYQSVQDLDGKYLWSKECKEMLLKPRNSMEDYCQQLQLNIDDTPVQYYVCENWKDYCGYHTERNMTTFRNQKCYCGRLTNIKADGHINLISVDSGFVRETASFLIHDDLSVMPNDLVKSLGLLQMNGINAITNIERKTLLINKMEVVDLLKLSLLSKTPLTDFILKKKPTYADEGLPSEEGKIGIGKGLPSEEGKQIKLLVRKSTRNILFGIADQDFADFLFSFLTFPLGGVLQMLEGFSSLSCIDILYKSMTELSPEICLRSDELKNELSKPQIFPTYGVRNQILPITTAEFSYTFDDGKYLKFVDPKSPVSGGYVRGPTTIMVTEELVVTPMSSFDVVSYLERMKVPLNDIEEIVVNIGVKEGLSILKASLTSTSAFTNGLKQYIDIPMCNLKKPKEEK